ncbi:hypothetical protein N9414_02004, partial [Nodularia spumigena CCY9414]
LLIVVDAVIELPWPVSSSLSKSAISGAFRASWVAKLLRFLRKLVSDC